MKEPPCRSSSKKLLGWVAAHVLRGLRVHQEGDNQAVQTQHFGENEDQDHANEEAGLLRGTADARVANNADGEAIQGKVVSL